MSILFICVCLCVVSFLLGFVGNEVMRKRMEEKEKMEFKGSNYA